MNTSTLPPATRQRRHSTGVDHTPDPAVDGPTPACFGGIGSFLFFLGPGSMLSPSTDTLADNAEVLAELEGKAGWVWAFQTTGVALAVLLVDLRRRTATAIGRAGTRRQSRPRPRRPRADPDVGHDARRHRHQHRDVPRPAPHRRGRPRHGLRPSRDLQHDGVGVGRRHAHHRRDRRRRTAARLGQPPPRPLRGRDERCSSCSPRCCRSSTSPCCRWRSS